MTEKVIELKWGFVKSYTYPFFDKYTVIKNSLMEKYEKETGKRSIFKIIEEPMGIGIIGKVQLTEGFLKWKKIIKK